MIQNMLIHPSVGFEQYLSCFYYLDLYMALKRMVSIFPFWSSTYDNVSLSLGINISIKDRQQERTAVLSRSHLKALCAFAPNALYVYYI